MPRDQTVSSWYTGHFLTLYTVVRILTSSDLVPGASRGAGACFTLIAGTLRSSHAALAVCADISRPARSQSLAPDRRWQGGAGRGGAGGAGLVGFAVLAALQVLAAAWRRRSSSPINLSSPVSRPAAGHPAAVLIKGVGSGSYMHISHHVSDAGPRPGAHGAQRARAPHQPRRAGDWRCSQAVVKEL